MAALRRPAPETDAPPAETVVAPAGEARRAGSSFDARYGKLIRTAGIGTVPFALFYYQAELGLQPQEVWFITYVLAHRWTSELPFPSLAGMARHSGLTKRALRNYKDSLVAKGFLIVHERRRPDGGTTSHGYDFSPLFDRLDALIMRDLHVWGQRSPQLLSAARQGAHALHPDTEEPCLPAEAPAFPGSRGTDVPPAGKRVLSGRKRAAFLSPGNAPSPRIETDPVEVDPAERHSLEPNSAERAIAAGDREDKREHRWSSGARTHDLRATGSFDNLAPATSNLQAARDSTQSEPVKRVDGTVGSEPGAADTGRAAVHSAPAVLPPPAALPDAVTGNGSALERLIDQLTQRFDDAPEHRAANRTRARRLWRESGMAEPEFLALVHEAERRTLECARQIRKRSTVSHNSANKMPYFFAVLANLVRAGAQGVPHGASSGAPGPHPTGPGAGQVQAGAPHAAGRHTEPCSAASQREQGQDDPAAVQAVWAAACEMLRARVSQASYRAFVEPAQPLRLEDGVLVLAAADLFAYEMLQRRFSALLERAVSEALGQPCRVVVLFPGEPVLPAGPSI